MGDKDGKTMMFYTPVFNRGHGARSPTRLPVTPLNSAGSYAVPYKTPREYDPETNRVEITWTEVPILARYRRGLTQ